MYYTYVLFAVDQGKIYTGYSSDLKRRLREHTLGKVHTTARMGKMRLVYYEAFDNEQDARDREKYLKTTQGKRTLRIMLKNTLHKS